MSELSNKKILEKVEATSRERERIKDAVHKLKEQAWDRYLQDKAALVARFLGEEEEEPDQHYPRRVYKKGLLIIYHRYVGVNEVLVEYKGAPVYVYNHLRTVAYRPDVPHWEKSFDEAYAEAERVIEDNRRQEQQRGVLQLAENWGIRTSDADAVPSEALPPTEGAGEPSEPKESPQTPSRPAPKFSYARRS